MSVRPPRLLPSTIVALAALIGMKTVLLVRAAAPIWGLGAAVAMAAETGSPKTAPVPPATPARSASPSGSPAAISPSERALLLDLRKRRKALDARAAALNARASVLAAAEQKLDQRVAELKTLQKRLETIEAARKQRESRAWDGLVNLYQSMKPRDAATIFNDLDMPVLLAVVDRMNARKAAAILADMQPDRAREVTAKLAALRLQGATGGGS